MSGKRAFAGGNDPGQVASMMTMLSVPFFAFVSGITALGCVLYGLHLDKKLQIMCFVNGGAFLA